MSKSVTVEEIVAVIKGNLLCGNNKTECEKFERDSRLAGEGNVFVGFKGEKRDGGEFYAEALEKGSIGCIVNKNIVNQIPTDGKGFIIEVEDTIKAIQKIAKLKREKYDIPVIAITGSVGKTSTKDIIASVVSQKYDVLKTEGNMNNHIGLPMTILGLKDHNALVVEMGMNHLGEIKVLTNIAQPTIAVITNVGTAHIGNLGSRENILKAKLEIIEGLNNNGTLVINNDNDLLNQWNNRENTTVKVKTYGINNKSDENAIEIKYEEGKTSYVLEENKNRTEINVPVGGEAFVYNSLSAICVGKILNIELDKIKAGIEKFELTKMRLDIKESSGGYTVINDCYNANYDSMKSAIEYLSAVKGNKKIAVLGDMLELGEFSKQLHESVGKEVVKNKIDVLITVGNEAKKIANVAQSSNIEVHISNDNKDAVSKIKQVIKKGDVILVKASNSMNFKEIVENIM